MSKSAVSFPKSITFDDLRVVDFDGDLVSVCVCRPVALALFVLEIVRIACDFVPLTLVSELLDSALQEATYLSISKSSIIVASKHFFPQDQICFPSQRVKMLKNSKIFIFLAILFYDKFVNKSRFMNGVVAQGPGH